MMKLATILLLLPVVATAQSNEHFSHTIETTAPPEAIWKIWTDVQNWKNWDKGLTNAMLKGEFKPGTKGKLIPDKGLRAKFVITSVSEGQSYSFKTRFPFGWLKITRTLALVSGKTLFTHEVEFTGLFKKTFARKLGVRYRAMLPEVMIEIKQIAEEL